VELIANPAERTTAATDAVLALASALGAAAHGLVLPAGVTDALWQPLYLALGVTVALFVVGALRDWRGERVGRRAVLPMLAVALAFYGATRAMGGSFLAFVIYEAAALSFALAVFVALARSKRRGGAAAMAAALAVSLGAGLVQAADLGPVRLIWAFDHNGIYHLVQLVGLALLVAGLCRLLAHPAPESRR